MGLGFDAGGIDEYVKSATVWNGIFFAGGAYTQAEGNPMDYISQWYEAPIAEPVAWMTTSTTTLCGSGCINFLDNSTNAPTIWNWSFPGSDTPTSTAQNPGSVCYASPGNYTATLQACNGIGCTTQDVDIEVASGATVSVNDQSICDGGSATLIAVPSIPGGSYLWSTGATSPSITVSPLVNTNYTVTYSYAGCTTGPTVSTVTIGTTPTLSLNVGTPAICEGNPASLTATPSASGGTYLWSPGGETISSITPSPSVTTNYTVEYTLNGCTSLLQNGTVTVTVTPTVTVADQSICNGESAILTASPSPGGGTYFWSPGAQTTASITVSPSTTTNYSVIYTLSGCPSTSEVSSVTVNPAPIVSVIESGNEITADQSGATYQWVDCDNSYAPVAGATGQTYVPTANGNYAVQIDLSGCLDTSACTLILTIGMDALNNSSVSVYPNPTTGLIYVSALNKGNLDYKFIDLMGKVVFSGKLTSENSSINISELSKGIYFFIAGEESPQAFKIIKN